MRFSWIISTVLLGLLALLFLNGVGVHDATASKRGETVVRLVVPTPDGESEEVRRMARTEVANMAAQRIETRLKRVGMKDFRVSVESYGILRVVAPANVDRQLLASIVVPQGRMELRPVIEHGQDWMSIESILPEGVELRHDLDTLRLDNAYLWSARRANLARFIDGMQLSDREVYLMADDGGWRTVTVGRVAVTHRDLEGIDKQTTPMGVPFVVMTIRGQALHKLRDTMASSDAQQVAMLLDGEIVQMLPYRPTQFRQTIQFSSPADLQDVKAQHAWTDQIVGRLAAPFPVVLAELTE